jgi:UDP-N-acetylglucosamine:LPS N-acetylglucosamine transferase
VYIGHKGDNFDKLKISTHDFDFTVFINGGKFRRYHGESLLRKITDIKTILLNARDFFRAVSAIGTSLKIMRKFKPDVVFSKGSFVAVPVGFAAKIRGIPIIKQQLKIPEDSQVLLLSGGGNGSQRLNDLMTAIARNLLESNLSLNIIHIAGRINEAAVKASYKALLPESEQDRVRVAGYIENFYAYSAAADLVISRAGATTLAELGAAGKACIIIPSPFLSGGHQLKNAELLAQKDAAVIVNEDVSPDELLVVVSELLNNDSRRWELAKNLYGTSHPEAAAKLAAIILETAALDT